MEPNWPASNWRRSVKRRWPRSFDCSLIKGARGQGGVDRSQKNKERALPRGTRSTRPGARRVRQLIHRGLFIYRTVPRHRGHLITAIYAPGRKRRPLLGSSGKINRRRSASDPRLPVTVEHRAETRRHAILSNELACSRGGSGQRFASRRDTAASFPSGRYADTGRGSRGW